MRNSIGRYIANFIVTMHNLHIFGDTIKSSTRTWPYLHLCIYRGNCNIFGLHGPGRGHRRTLLFSGQPFLLIFYLPPQLFHSFRIFITLFFTSPSPWNHTAQSFQVHGRTRHIPKLSALFLETDRTLHCPHSECSISRTEGHLAPVTGSCSWSARSTHGIFYCTLTSHNANWHLLCGRFHNDLNSL